MFHSPFSLCPDLNRAENVPIKNININSWLMEVLRRSYFENGFLLILRVKKDKGGKHLKVPNLSDLYVLDCT